MEEEKKDIMDETEAEEKETVEVEIVDENTPTVSEQPQGEAPQVEEVIEPGLTRDLVINQTTYNEFYNRNLLKRQLTTTGYTAIIMIVILYLFRGEQTMPQFLTQAAIYVGVIIVVSLLFTVVTTKLMVKRNYDRSGLATVSIKVTFNTQGIVQQVQDQMAMTKWEEIVSVEETENSFFFFSAGRRAVILSKEKLWDGDIDYIRSLAKGKIGEDCYKIIQKKKKENRDGDMS